MDNPLPYSNDTTSRAAADSMRHRSLTDEQYIAAWVRLREFHGATCDEIEEALGLSHQGASARCNSLVHKEILLMPGEVRKTRHARYAQVYIHRSLVDPATAHALVQSMREVERLRAKKRLQTLQNQVGAPA